MLSVENVSVYYDGLRALASVSLQVKEEEFVCILGPNGAGKSTLLQTISGLLVPKEGEIRFGGEAIQGIRPHRVAALGIVLVPEEGWLFPQMNVQENLYMGAYLRETRKRLAERIDFIFHLFPILKQRQRQMSETLSGGERQMLAVGRGMMSDPKLLMLDEPSLGLAPLAVRDILDALSRINREEKTPILLTEQNIFHALKLSQRGYLLENASIALEGKSGDLLGNDHIKKNYLGL